MNTNNYSRLHQTYIMGDDCGQYQIFKTQKKCPKQTQEDSKEHFGAFSISAAVRQPWGGCCDNCSNCNENQYITGVK